MIINGEYTYPSFPLVLQKYSTQNIIFNYQDIEEFESLLLVPKLKINGNIEYCGPYEIGDIIQC